MNTLIIRFLSKSFIRKQVAKIYLPRFNSFWDSIMKRDLALLPASSIRWCPPKLFNHFLKGSNKRAGYSCSIIFWACKDHT